MKRFLIVLTFGVLMGSWVWAQTSANNKPKLNFTPGGYVAWSRSRQCKVEKFLVWKVGNPTSIQKIYVPLDIVENKKMFHQYLNDAFSFDGTPVPTPTHFIVPTFTPTVTATPDSI